MNLVLLVVVIIADRGRPHSKSCRYQRSQLFKYIHAIIMNQMGMRPGIIILREGTDTSQVSKGRNDCTF